MGKPVACLTHFQDKEILLAVKWSQLALTSMVVGVGAGSSEGIFFSNLYIFNHTEVLQINPSPSLQSLGPVCFLGLTPSQTSAKVSTNSAISVLHPGWSLALLGTLG